jgi:hypothetical protein
MALVLPLTAVSRNLALPDDLPPPPARSIVLVGMPGAGKSSIGRRLAARWGLPFRDADTEIEQAAGASVGEIFSRTARRISARRAPGHRPPAGGRRADRARHRRRGASSSRAPAVPSARRAR